MTVHRSERTEKILARLLLWGVVSSFAIVSLGALLLLKTGETGYGSVRLDDVNSILQSQPGVVAYPDALFSVLAGVLALKPYAIIALGLLVLIATPVLRVAASILALAWERDWLYVAITIFVLTMLAISFLIGGTGG